MSSRCGMPASTYGPYSRPCHARTRQRDDCPSCAPTGDVRLSPSAAEVSQRATLSRRPAPAPAAGPRPRSSSPCGPPAAAAPPPSATPLSVAVRDPRCLISREPRLDEHTICTAVAPDDVFTIRTYGDTRAVIARHHLAVPKRQAEGW